MFNSWGLIQVKVQGLSALSSVVKMVPGKFADASKFGAIMWVKAVLEVAENY